MTDFAAALYGQPATAPAATPTPSSPSSSSVADRLFGSPPGPSPDRVVAASPPVDVATPRETQQEAEARLGEVLYGEVPPVVIDVPEHIVEMRKAEGPNLYGDRPAPEIEQLFRDDAERLADLDPAVLAAAKVETSRMAADLGLDRSDIETFTSAARQIRVTPPTPEMVAGWQQQAMGDLVERYGESGAASALEAARKLATRDPRTARILDQTGLGNHPDVIARFVRLAMDQRHKGRL